jgi:hypothetical protein
MIKSNTNVTLKINTKSIKQAFKAQEEEEVKRISDL